MSDVTLLEVYQPHHPIEYDGSHVVCLCNRYVLSGKGRYEIERHFKNRGHLAYVANPQGMTMNGTLSDTLLRQRYNHEPIEYREEEGGVGGVVVCVCNEFVLSGRNKYAIERHFEGKNHLDYVAKWRNENNNNNNNIGVDNDEEEEGENDGVVGDNDNVAVVLENDAAHEEGENGNDDENVAVALENDAGDGDAKEREEEELELGQSNSGTDNAEAALEDDAVDIHQEEELGSRQSNDDGNNGDDTLENDSVNNKKEGESISRQAAI